MIGEDLEAVFESNRSRQYRKQIEFSQMANAMADVVLGFCSSPTQAYKEYQAEFQASSTAFYNKLNRIEASTSEAVVRHSHEKANQFFERVGIPTVESD